jgi:hypothetical protein
VWQACWPSGEMAWTSTASLSISRRERRVGW